MAAVFDTIRDGITALRSLFQRWALSRRSARLVAGLIGVVAVVSCLLIIMRDTHSASRLMGEIDWRLLMFLFPLMILLASGVAAYRVLRRKVDFARTRTAFVSNVSHEMKTPLSAIQLYNTLLSEMDPEDPERGTFHRIIAQEVTRLATMTDNVLQFSDMEKGQVQLNLEKIDLRPLLIETVQIFRRLFGERGYHFGLVVPDTLALVYADLDALRQVIVNLLDNAVKYSEPHTIFVQAYVAHREMQRFVVVDIQDRGIGIDRDKRHRVFEPFYRAESGLAQRVSGSGLGLSIVHSVVEAHDGRMEVESTPGEGATFRVLLPAVPLTEPEMTSTS